MLADPQISPRYDVDPVNSRKQRPQLYAARKKIFPKRANGSFRRFKWLVMLVTLGIASFFGLFGVQLAIPAVARVGVNGVYFAFITLVGLGLGPLVTGALKSVAIGGMPLGHALVVTALMTVAVCAPAVAATRLADRRQLAS